MSNNRIMLRKNRYMLKGLKRRNSYDWWWHSFTAYHKVTGEPRAFFIEYFVINPGLSPKKEILCQSEKADSGAYVNNSSTGDGGAVQNTAGGKKIRKNKRPSYVMIKAGAWGKGAKQIHNFYPSKMLTVGRKDLSIKIGECSLTENELHGSVYLSKADAQKPEFMSSAGSMKWNLSMKKTIPFDVGYSTSWLSRFLNAFEMYWHAQGVKTQYSGSVVLDGEEYGVYPQNSYGYADKNWGRDYTNPWLWLSSCNLVSLLSGKRLQNSCFDVGGGRPRIFGIDLPKKVLLYFFYEGMPLEFNFSKFWKTSDVTYSVTESDEMVRWSVSAHNSTYLVDIEIFSRKADMIFINYESPKGFKEHERLWNGGSAYGEIRLYKKVKKTLEIIEHARVENCGCEYGEH